MKYIIKGKLSADVCADCSVPISSTSIRAYKVQDTKNEKLLVAAATKETFHMLSTEEAKQRRDLLGEGLL